MRPQLAPLFLILVAAVALNFSLTRTVVVMVLYSFLSDFDRWWERRQRRKELDKLRDDEISDWNPSSEGSEWESKGSMARVRLTGAHQLLYGRIVEFLSRMGR